jgi:hypothetical protein
VSLGSFALGLLVAPALTVVAATGYWLKVRIVRQIEQAKPGNVRVRAVLAATVFASNRAYVGRFPHFTLALTFGRRLSTQDQAEAVLLDEFDPIKEDA